MSHVACYACCIFARYRPPRRLESLYNFVQSDALAFLRALPDDTLFDFVFVDDLHTAEHVQQVATGHHRYSGYRRGTFRLRRSLRCWSRT